MFWSQKRILRLPMLFVEHLGLLWLPFDYFFSQGDISVSVEVPVETDPKWQCNGQVVSLTFTVLDKVYFLLFMLGFCHLLTHQSYKKTRFKIADVKQKLAEAVGMPAGKQKLSRLDIVFNNQKTLAFYNIGAGAVIQLSKK